MTKKIDVPVPDIAGEPNGIIPVTSLEAGLLSNRLSMRLSLRARGENAEVTTYALSPPAAARLARDLQKAVNEYLYGDQPSGDGETSLEAPQIFHGASDEGTE